MGFFLPLGKASYNVIQGNDTMASKYLTKTEVVRSFREEILPEIVVNEHQTGGKDYPARRTAWNDYIDSLIKSEQVRESAGDWDKPACCGE